MQKEAFYFPHFSNARHDRKIRRLRKELGIEGYGIYFMLLETLRDQHDFMYPLSDCDLLAEEFGTSEAKIQTVIGSYELFDFEDDGKFFSPKMLVYLEPYFKMREQRIQAGKASAAKRLLNDRSTTVQQSKVKESKVNEIKVKESKVNNIEEFEFFWNTYNKKIDRVKCEKVWSRLTLEEVDKIIQSVSVYVNSTPDSKYRKNPLTYLNGKCFNDEVVYYPKQELGKLQQNMISLKNVHDQLTEEIQNGTFKNPYK